MNVTTQGIGHKVMSVLMALVLAIGLAPMVPAGTAWAVTDATAWQDAVVKYTVEADEDDAYVVDYADGKTDFGVVSFTPVGYDEALPTTDYDVEYYKADKTTLMGEDDTFDAGQTYWIAIKTKGDSVEKFGNSTHWQEFSIGAKPASSLENAEIYVVNPEDPSDLSQTDVVYNGTQFTFDPEWDGGEWGTTVLGLKIGDKALTHGKDYTVKTIPGDVKIKDAGTYTVEFKGNAAAGYTGTHNINLTVKPLDLSTVTVTAKDLQYTGGTLTADLDVEGLSAESVKSELTTKVTSYSIPGTTGDAPTTIQEKGTYGVSVTPVDNNKNITSSATASFDVVGALVTDFKYDGEPFSDTVLTFDNSVKDSAFDIEKIVVMNGSEKLDPEKGDYEVIVTKDGKEVTEWTEPGNYVATVKVAVDDEYTLGGTATQEFKVYDGEIDVLNKAKIYVLVDGKNVPAVGNAGDGIHVTYTGEAHDVVVVVKDAEGNVLEQGVDYNVKITNSAAVEASVLEPGSYQVQITDGNYDVVSTGYFEINVDKIKITGVQGDLVSFSEDVEALPYTGEAVVPGVQYTTGEKDADGNLIWTDLDSSLYTLTYTNQKSESIEECVEPGYYRAYVELTKDAQKYYEFVDDTDATTSFRFQIAETVAFTDVKTTDWFANVVYQAASLKYMNGFEGTSLFLPNADITRAEMAQVIFNMVGATPGSDTEAGFDDMTNDYDWAVNAVNWATKAGVITGYGPDFTSFGPGDTATREQVATILYRYAQVTGQDVAVEDADAALTEYNDGAQVSDWAKEAVAWAVEQGIMGVDVDVLNPQGNVLRAEVAAMSVRTQPEPFDKDVDIDIKA